MNATDRRRLFRIAACLSVPAAAVGGTKSADTSGYIGHSRDSAVALVRGRRCLSALAAGESTWVCGVSVEEEILAFEAWHARRVEDRWNLEGAGETDTERRAP